MEGHSEELGVRTKRQGSNGGDGCHTAWLCITFMCGWVNILASLHFDGILREVLQLGERYFQALNFAHNLRNVRSNSGRKKGTASTT